MKKRFSFLVLVLGFSLTTGLSQVLNSISNERVKASANTTEDPTNLIIDVPGAGYLSNILPAGQAALVVSLKLTGYLNSADINYLRSYLPLLANLDLSEAIYSSNYFQNDAFNGKKSLVRVRMPKQITIIGTSAFNGCSSLKRVILPDSLRSIYYYGFANCTLLDSLILPAKMSGIYYHAFENCYGLQSMSFPKGFTSLSDNVFRNCTGLKSVNFPDTLTTINESTFYNCTSLQQVRLPAKLNSINNYVFSHCSSLDSIALPVTLTSIGYEAFGYCSSLKSVILPNYLTSMQSFAFRDCGALKTVVLPTNFPTITDNVFYNCSSINFLKLPENLINIGGYAFYNCNSLQKLNLPSLTQSIGNNAFQYCSKLDSLLFPSTITQIGTYAFSDCSSLKMVKLPGNLTDIDDGVFSYCSSLDSIVFPVGLTQIGNYAFRDCNALKGQLVLPEYLTYIGYIAFNNCGYYTCKSLASTPPSLYDQSSLGNLKIVFVPVSSVAAYKSAWSSFLIIGGDSLTFADITLTSAGTLGDAILQKYPSLYLKDVHKLKVTGPMNTTDLNVIKQSITSLVSLNIQNAQLTQIPDNQFKDKNLMLEILLPDSLTSIGTRAFYGCATLVSIRIPKKIVSIPDYTFQYCYNLVSVYLPEGITSMGYQSFYNCSSLENITLPQSLTYMGSESFAYCYKLKSINIPANLGEINYSTFYSCNSLKNVTFPDSGGPAYISNHAFYDCAIENLKLSENISYVDDYAFYSNNISHLILPDKLTSLGSWCFGYCSLDSIFLPAALSSIEGSAFGYCTSLRNVRCEQPTPPVLSSDPFNSVDKTICSLTVPFWTSNIYKQANIWSSFYPIYTVNNEIKDLPISADLVLSDNIRPVGKPNVTILNQGSLTVRGNAPFTNKLFTLTATLNNGWDYSYGYTNYSPYYAEMISECNAITADQVNIRLTANSGNWYYLTFPFDVAVDSLSINNSAQFVFRKYDGASRAVNGAGSSWKTMTNDSILKAGEGYIYQCSVASELNVVPKEASKNQVFASENRSFPLKEYASTTLANKNWNFMGNPYPAFYDIFYMEIMAPITVWDNRYKTYKALSRTDDQYALKPYEAFFVQKPNDLSQLTFPVQGRQITYQIIAENHTMTRFSSAVDRTLINLSISNENYMDKCRLVINPNASLSYELKSDASKFMSGQTQVPQLYTLDENGEKYAINERPLGTGVIRLGCYIGEAGTYVLAAPDLTKDTENVILTDKLLQKQTTLNEQSYQFTTAEGTFNDRFEINVLNIPTKLESNDLSLTNVWCTSGTINIATKPGNKVSVFSLNGLLIKEWIAPNAHMQLSLNKGVYLVKVAGKTFKSVVF